MTGNVNDYISQRFFSKPCLHNTIGEVYTEKAIPPNCLMEDRKFTLQTDDFLTEIP